MKSIKPLVRSIRSITLLVLLAVLAGYLYVGLQQAWAPQPQRLQGEIDARYYHVAAKIPGRVSALHVEQGQAVAAGELLLQLSTPELDAKLTQAQAGLSAAEAQYQEAEDGVRKQQLQAAEDQWRKAEAALKLYTTTYQRIDRLYKDGVLPEQKRDEARTEMEAARFTASAAEQQYKLAKEGARDETRRAASGARDAAAGQVAEVQAMLADSELRAPHSGEVALVMMREGELLPQGFPVIRLVDRSDSWAVFSVREDKLPQFTVGSQLPVTIPALGAQEGKQAEHLFEVTYVAAMGEFATWQATTSQSSFDMRTFEVQARPVKPIHELRPGMSVLVDLDRLAAQSTAVEPRA